MNNTIGQPTLQAPASERRCSLGLFTAFHLNLAYSSVDPETHPEIIERCYTPLLDLIDGEGFALGIEASGQTLERIHTLAPAWIERFAMLLQSGSCELLGSGYVQLIGPLVPADVNRANQLLGLDTYRRLLDYRPQVAFISEQAFSPGLVEHYVDAGYAGVMADWDNVVRLHPEWNRSWARRPQRARGCADRSIPILWNQSVGFQKFQRYTHGELELEELLDYLVSQSSEPGDDPSVWCLYGSDAEVFDFRPGRFASELPIDNPEWGRIQRLLRRIVEVAGLELILPSQALHSTSGSTTDAGSGRLLQLSTAAEPIPVKKQGKYNITRWALTGRDDLQINSRCLRLHRALKERVPAQQLTLDPTGDTLWRQLCEAWSSDLRTHITPSRWEAAQQGLTELEQRIGISEEPTPPTGHTGAIPQHACIERCSRWLTVQYGQQRVVFNLRRGLAVASWAPIGGTTIFGTLPHGFYDDIDWTADFYTGHVVFERPGQAKVTDLAPVDPIVSYDDEQARLWVQATIDTALGPVTKRYGVSGKTTELTLDTTLEWPQRGMGRLRLGHVTLHPQAFDPGCMMYATHNGGRMQETYALGAGDVDHGSAVSFLVSARHVLGMTEGWMQIGDARSKLTLWVDRQGDAVLPMITVRRIGASWFGRVSFSAQEIDDTSRGLPEGPYRPIRAGLTLRWDTNLD